MARSKKMVDVRVIVNSVEHLDGESAVILIVLNTKGEGVAKMPVCCKRELAKKWEPYIGQDVTLQLSLCFLQVDDFLQRVPKKADACPDCGKEGARKGHMDCEYPNN